MVGKGDPLEQGLRRPAAVGDTHCPGRVGDTIACWDALDRFACEVPLCGDERAATRRFVVAVREALSADLVVCCTPNVLAESDDLVSSPAPAPRWSRGLLAQALAESPGVEGQLLRSFWSPPVRLGLPSSCSLAMVRLSRSRALWAAAVNLGSARPFRVTDMTLFALAGHLLANAWRSQRTEGRFRSTILGLVNGFSTAIDQRDIHMAGHSQRVARIAVRLGEQMGLPPADIGDLYLISQLHDIGKLGIPEEILHKPGQLAPSEMARVKEHPALGASIVAQAGPIAHLAPIIRAHHERYDGRGYPDGLAGERIPLLARVLAVADSVDAMMATRPYRPALSPDRMETTLISGAGSQWDGRIIRHLLECRNDVYALARVGALDFPPLHSK